MSCFSEPSNNNCGFTEDLRYLQLERTENMRKIYEEHFIEQVARYGMEVEYVVNLYELSSHNSIYGEHTTKDFADPEKLVMYVIYNNDSIILNQYGIDSQGDITAFIPFSSFEAVFGEGSEPKSGDIIHLTEYGNSGRPNDRGFESFEITHRDDQDIEQTIPLMGHYAWRIWAKRYDYSYENNVKSEPKNNQINDDVSNVDVLSINPTLSSVIGDIDKTYDDTADELGKLIFDYDEHDQSNDSVYGDY